MQLCTNARLFLDLVAASGRPKLWALTPPEARKKVIELTRIVECKEAIGKIEDRILPGPAGPLPFRIYTPVVANDEPSGGVIFFHGGAWVLGDLDMHGRQWIDGQVQDIAARYAQERTSGGN